jgi:hypothetical protein
MLADVELAETVAEPIDIDAWLGTEVDDEVSFGDRFGVEATAPVDELTSAPADPVADEHADADAHGPWTRTSDDLLPRARRGRRIGLSLRR